ncbi:MAG: hypothetical protein A3G81_34135 [Betaproteobacteria bacterium RIFCSPLOWO2_12_FULL_65_14]|nr:MAG: hypothetical protein A3G81_34135 [Betaproteobacteria bacterium RIFCSPLOWO2_12_FULL_65_14]
MNAMRDLRIAAAFLAVLSFGLPSLAWAQSYPSKPIRVINPFSPGGSSDTLARTIGQHLTERLGQPVLVESRTGAGGNIGADAAAKSAPDGYTLLMGTNFLPVAAVMHRKLSYDVVKDLAPVTLIGGTSMLLVASVQFPAQTFADFVALAKAKPGEIAYASAGAGTPNHLAMELLNQRLGINMRHVPYRSNPLAMNDVMGGHIPLLMDFVSTGGPHVRSGKVRGLAVTGTTRAKVLPDVPTVRELGVPNYEAGAWFAVFAPGKTPRAIIMRLHSDITAVLAMQSVEKSLNDLGVEVAPAGPDELGALVKTEIQKWNSVVEKAGIPKMD